MRKLLLIIICLSSFNLFARLHPESVYADKTCAMFKGKREVTLKDSTRADCVNDKYAVEVEFANKYYQAVGQSLHYARMTGKKAAIILILESNKDKKYLERLKADIKHHSLNIVLTAIGPQAVATKSKAQTKNNRTSGVVKKSRSGICHDTSSRYYSRTKRFKPFNSLSQCLKSGGRLPKV